MDIALQDIKYKNYKSKIQELENKLELTYKKLQKNDNDYLKDLVDDYKEYIKLNENIKKKKREALENILEHIESQDNYNNNDLKMVSREIKKFF
tara:strand:- start:603 stop:884 length:282 start_codon:yes stop_codon:yes gene_type:complete